jgi:hypothetical protein
MSQEADGMQELELAKQDEICGQENSDFADARVVEGPKDGVSH